MGRGTGTVVGLVLLLGVAAALFLGRASEGEQSRAGESSSSPSQRAAPPPADLALRGAPAAPSSASAESPPVEPAPKAAEEKAEPAFPVPEALRGYPDVRGVVGSLFGAAQRVDRLYGDGNRVRLVAMDLRRRQVKGEIEAETPALLDAALQAVRDEFGVPATEFGQVELPDREGRRAASFEFRTTGASAADSWEPSGTLSLAALGDAFRTSGATLRSASNERTDNVERVHVLRSRVFEVVVPDLDGLRRTMFSLAALPGLRTTGFRWTADSSGKLKVRFELTVRLPPRESADAPATVR